MLFSPAAYLFYRFGIDCKKACGVGVYRHRKTGQIYLPKIPLTSYAGTGIIDSLKPYIMALKCCGFPGILEGGKYRCLKFM